MERNMQELLRRAPAVIFVLATAVLVVVIGIGSVYLTKGGSGGSQAPAAEDDMVMSVAHEPMPDYVLAGDRGVQLAYQFAVERPDVLKWMPCYCGCGDHSAHKNNLSCFVKDGGAAFDEHGSNCDVCVGIALDAMTMTEEGRSLKEIRTYIDGTYGEIGPGTDTPLPPG
jgi:hypothetical protein